MADFKFEKNGYNKADVDNFLRSIVQDFENRLQDQKIRISDLKRELESVNEQLSKFKQKNDNISDALVVAVETAKKIENNSKSMYELEIKRLRNLYDKWDNVLQQFLQDYPKLQTEFDTKILLKKFSDGIDEVLAQNTTSINSFQQKNETSQSVDLKSLITRMGGSSRGVNTHLKEQESDFKKSVNENENKPKIERNLKPSNDTIIKHNLEKNYDEESNRLKSQIKPIANMNLESSNKYESLMDKFLQADEDDENAYSKAIFNNQKNESGFDLKEALNPKEDLEEIMKSFSFYPNKDEKNKK